MSANMRSDNVPITQIPNNTRVNKLSDAFSEEFVRKPCYFVKVPGRVNIIGEHIDYCGYPVLPMALEQDILIAVGLQEEHKVCMRNVNKRYENYDAEIKKFEDMKIEPDSNGKPFWYNYLLCGIKGALEHMENKIINGLNLYVDGNIPPASGLSSSSALVSAACLAFLYAQNVNLSKTEIASLCAKSERYIGTQGGGMDQAIAFLAEKYSAQYITWQPLQATAVSLPEDAAFVVAHSMAEANKAATNHYNRRVIECRLSAKILDALGGGTKDKKIITLSQVQKNLGNSLEEMIELVHKYLPKDIYTKDEISNILNIDVKEMHDLYFTPNTKHINEFKLKQRALHVYEEAMRVEEFRQVCMRSNVNGKSDLKNGSGNHENGNGDTSGVLETLGKMMLASHESLKNLYECSHDNLDLLVDISRKAGAYSRLTGAGWGGCIVALCAKEKVQSYIDELIEHFYKKHCNIESDKAQQYVFATTPNHGAIIYKDK